MGMEDEDVDGLAPLAGLDRGRARVAGGGADDGDTLAAALEDMVEEPADELERHVLEGERGAVEELHEPFPGAELPQGGHGLVIEARIGLAYHCREGLLRDRAAEEGEHHAA